MNRSKSAWMTVAFLVAGLAGSSLSRAQTPAEADFIFLIDDSGSMEFSLDGKEPAAGAPATTTTPLPAGQTSWERLWYVRNTLPVIGDILTTMNGLVTDGGLGVDVRFAFAIFPGDPVSGTSCPCEDVTWLGTGSPDLRNWGTGEYSTIVDGLATRWSGTPLYSALNEADAKWDAEPTRSTAEKHIFMLTDGAPHGGDTDLAAGFDSFDDVTVSAIGFGEAGADETNQALLDTITGDHGGTFLPIESHTDATALKVVTTTHLANFFTDLGWDTVSDPTFIVTDASRETLDVEVTEYDHQLFFVCAWHEPRFENKSTFTIETPGGTLTPETVRQLDTVRYSEGSTYQMYTAGTAFLADNPGTWKLTVDGASLPPRTQQVTSFLVGGPTDLDLVNDERLPSGPIPTGSALPFVFHAAAHDSLLTDVRMEVQIVAPDESPGNWYAANTLTPAERRKVLSQRFGGYVTDPFKKTFYLQTEKNVALPGTTPTMLSLFDDGAHGDGEADDGIFGNSIAELTTPGLYRTRVVAEGTTSAGAPFTRESWGIHVVEPDIDGSWATSDLHVRVVSRGTGTTAYEMTFVPRDRFGNHLAPGHGEDIDVRVSDGARLTGDLEDDLQGGYVQRVEVDSDAEPPVVQIAFKGVAFPERELTPARCDWSVVVLAGTSFFDDSLLLDDAPTLALGLRRCATPRVRIGATLATSPTDDNLGNSGAVLRAGLDVTYLLGDGNRIVPFATVGGGWLGFRGFLADDDVPALSFGGGVEVRMAGGWSIVADARDEVAFDAFGSGTSHSPVILVGLSLGGSE